jgi:hypothetical protein
VNSKVEVKRLSVQSRLRNSISDRSLLIALTAGFFYCSALVLRAPDILIRGRYFAEEGAFWWSHALASNWVGEISFVAPLTGYLLLNANLQVLVASHLPLEIGPLWTAWSSVGLSVLPAVITWLARPNWMERRWVGVSSLGFLIAPFATTSEVFANSINGQTFLGLAAAVVLVLGVENRSRVFNLGTVLVVTLGALSGWYTAVLAPLFVMRAFAIRRSRTNIALATVTTFGLLVQISVFLSMQSQKLLWPGKVSSVPTAEAFPRYAMNSFALNLFGEKSVSPSGWPPPMTMAVTFSVALFLGFSVYGVFRCCDHLRGVNRGCFNYIGNCRCFSLLLALGAFFVELALVVFGQAEPYFGGRYLVVPGGCLFLVMTITLSGLFNTAIIRTSIWVAFFALVVFNSISNWTRTTDTFLHCLGPCVSWEQQVSEIREGDRMVVGHWPMSSDPGDWVTNVQSPKVELAPFQRVTLDASRKTPQP